MAQIFISHSTRDSELVSRIIDLLETGVGIDGSAIFASSVAGLGVPHGDFREHIVTKLRSAALAVFVLSPNFQESPFCVAEMGAAWALGTPSLIYVTPGLTHADVRGVFGGGYQIERLEDASSLDKLRDVAHDLVLGLPSPPVARWNAQSRAFRQWLLGDYQEKRDTTSRPEDMPGWRDRGHWSAAIVDGTIYTNGSADVDVKRKVIREIEQGHVPSTVFSYQTDSGFHNWIQLTHDPGYRYFAESLAYFRDHGARITNEIIGATNSAEVDFVSLGPGDGQKDLTLLRALADQAADASRLYYYPFDINPSMISAALRLIGTESRLRPIKVKAILADFNSLPQFSPIYHYRSAANVLSLLGNTLGNFADDRGLLERVFERAMSAGDVLLLEVRNREDGPGSDLGRELSKRFNFGALDIIGVPFESDKMEYVELKRARSTIPGAKTSLAQYRGAEINGEVHDSIDLAVINRYDGGELVALCRDIGFHVVADPRVEGSVLALLLQKP